MYLFVLIFTATFYALRDEQDTSPTLEGHTSTQGGNMNTQLHWPLLTVCEPGPGELSNWSNSHRW